MSSCSGLFLCMCYANSRTLCRAQDFNLHLVIPIDQVVYLLFIVDCNNSDNRKKVQHFFVFPLSDVVRVEMPFNNFSKLINRSIFTGCFCKRQSQKQTFLVIPLSAQRVTLTCAFYSRKPLADLNHFTFGKAFKRA